MDEFVVKMLGSFEEKEFRSVSDDDLGLETDEEKKATQAAGGGKPRAARLCERESRRKNRRGQALSQTEKRPRLPVDAGQHHPGDGALFRFTAAKRRGGDEGGAGSGIQRRPSVFETLKKAFASDRDKAAKYAELLYDQALLMAGLSPDDPARFSELVSELMV
jgi:molecular chaperone HtpG